LKKTLVLLILGMTITGMALAAPGTGPGLGAPEIDASVATTVLALLSGGLLLVRDRK